MAPFSAITESAKLYRQASRFSATVRPIRRVCTSAECRYKLCGITVAPRIPIAMYRLCPFRRGTRPDIISCHAGLANHSSTPKHPVITAIK